MINGSLAFQQHALEASPLPPILTPIPLSPPFLLPPTPLPLPPSPSILSFSKAVEIMTNILYTRKNRKKEPTLYSYDEFRKVMKEKNTNLKFFFDELYLSSNPSSKNRDSQARAKKQLLFVCYFLCGI